MITLITGTPGSGKTAYGLDFMLKTVKEGRPLYVHGIPELKLPHIVAYCDSPACDVCTHYTEEEKQQKMVPANDWHNYAPDGAVFFFDETQNIYRPRSSGSKVPDNVAAFEVHRHKGLDFFLITQSPRLIDSNIRALVSRHIHLRVNWKGRKQFEWPETKDNPQSTSDAIASSYTLNKKIFPLYKSASLHTKQKRKIPPALYLAAAVFTLTSYAFYNAYTGMSRGIKSDTKPVRDGVSVETPAARQQQINQFPQQITRSNQIPPQLDFRPTIPGVPESAPAYSSVLTVKDFPRLVGCISNHEKCTCYTQQGTVYPASPAQCADVLESKNFNPFQEPAQAQPDQGKSSSDKIKVLS